MPERSFFSIIIPTFNSEGTIAACLYSITRQEFIDYEILIIDGCSKDKTGEILAGYAQKEPRLKLFREKDEGIYDAMNKGITRAKGEYLYFMGSDDTLYNENVLTTVVKNLAETDAKVLHGNVVMKGSSKLVGDGKTHGGEFSLRRILSDNIGHQAIFYHHSVFQHLGNYSLKYPVFADYDFNLRCFSKYKFLYIDAIIANFNVGGASTQITDKAFEADKLKNVIRYFSKGIFSREFVDCRLYVQQAAFSKKSGIDLSTRLYCMLAYLKLKTLSLLR